MKRHWVELDARITRCVLLDDKHNVKNRFRAYQLSGAKKLTAIDLRRYDLSRTYGSVPYALGEAAQTYHALNKACCYAFHCNLANSVKLGQTTELFHRWAKLENEGGRPLQLVAVWQVPDRIRFEAMLHQMFAPHRGLGEWFAADDVLTFIRAQITRYLTARTQSA